jgi:hypothetical protein
MLRLTIRPIISIGIAALVAAAVILTPWRSPAASGQAKTPPANPCYAASTQAVDGPGVFQASGSGVALSRDFHFDTAASRVSTTASVVWSFQEFIVGPNGLGGDPAGNMGGQLTLSITATNGITASFTARCVAEAYTLSQPGGPTGQVYMAVEGTITGFPITSSASSKFTATSTPMPAVAFFWVYAEPPSNQLRVYFRIHNGTRCDFSGTYFDVYVNDSGEAPSSGVIQGAPNFRTGRYSSCATVGTARTSPVGPLIGTPRQRATSGR